jgi:formylglycine-generating enzyme required for sulfatase activity
MGSAKMNISGIVWIVAIALALFAYNASAAGATDAAASQGDGPQVLATVNVPAGPYIRGSDAAEREYGYALDGRAYGHSATRKGRWYAGEYGRSTRHLPAYRITATPITNAQYAAFIAATDHPAPDVDIATWCSYRLNHPWKRTRRHVWPGGQVPDERIGHPVVLVSRADASAYAVWLSRLTGMRWRLPTEEEWEKAARGTEGRRFPWGGSLDAARLNSHDSGPYDTMPVGSYPAGASPYGMLDAAGQVFEWTSTTAARGRFIVKGGSWDDKGCGVCRPAARHSRPADIKHILIGFRLIVEQPLAPASR